METDKKRITKRQKSKVRRVPHEIEVQIERFGDGNFNHGLFKVGGLCKCLNDNNGKGEDLKRQILASDVNTLMDHIRMCYPGLASQFDCFPDFFFSFLNTGEFNFTKFRGGRLEPSLEEITKKKPRGKK